MWGIETTLSGFGLGEKRDDEMLKGHFFFFFHNWSTLIMFIDLGEFREIVYRSKREDVVDREKSQVHPQAGDVVKIKIVCCPIVLEHEITNGGELDRIARFKRKQEKYK